MIDFILGSFLFNCANPIYPNSTCVFSNMLGFTDRDIEDREDCVGRTHQSTYNTMIN